MVNKVSHTALIETAAPPEQSEDDVWISEHDVAKQQRRHVATIRNYAKDPRVGFPQPHVIRKRRYFRKSEIEAWARRFSDQFATYTRAA